MFLMKSYVNVCCELTGDGRIFLLCFVFVRAPCLAETGFELMILLPQPYRCANTTVSSFDHIHMFLLTYKVLT